MTTTAPADARLTQLADRDEIADLVSRLGVALDEGRFEDLRSLFVEGATARTPGGTAEGREALIAQARRNHRPDQGIQHVTTNVLVDLDGDRATVRANLVVHFASTGAGARQLPVPAPPVEFTLGEVYRFEAARTPDGWRFSRVETTPIWAAGTPSPSPAPQPA